MRQNQINQIVIEKTPCMGFDENGADVVLLTQQYKV